MEDDFILPENETPSSSQRNFLLTVITLLATLIAISLCTITLLLAERKEDFVASLSQSTSSSSSTPVSQSTAAASSSSPIPAARIVSSTVPQTETAESPQGAHRIIEYKNLKPANSAALTTVPHKPHRVISYDNPNSGDESDMTIEKRDGSE